MTSLNEQPPCGQGLRCPNPETCDHKFRHPDGSENRLHPDDWFEDEPVVGAEPSALDYAGNDLGAAAYRDDLTAWNAAKDQHDRWAATQARALWACKLDCPMRLECLEIGMRPGPTLAFGIYGGYTAAQRREITREREARRTSR